jgi:hypothetical protein
MRHSKARSPESREGFCHLGGSFSLLSRQLSAESRINSYKSLRICEYL